MIGRFAPSTTGPAHLGTAMAALLCWLDARARGMAVLLRLEDLDPERCRGEHASALQRQCAWLGLEWDGMVVQSERREAHAAALDRLAARGLVYPDPLSRQERAAAIAAGTPQPSRDRDLPAGGWRASEEPLRLRLPTEAVVVDEESDYVHASDPGSLDDPLLRRRDGAMAYHLVSVVDDGLDGVTRVVRGRDLAGCSPVQVAIRRLLELPPVRYRHHFMVLEANGRKHSKHLHSVDLDRIGERLAATEVVGHLAAAAGLLSEPRPCRPEDLIETFDWRRVRDADVIMTWQDGELRSGAAS